MMTAENDPLGPLPPGWGELLLFFFYLVHLNAIKTCPVFQFISSKSKMEKMFTAS